MTRRFLTFEARRVLGFAYSEVECDCGWSYRHRSAVEVAEMGWFHLTLHRNSAYLQRVLRPEMP